MQEEEEEEEDAVAAEPQNQFLVDKHWQHCQDHVTGTRLCTDGGWEETERGEMRTSVFSFSSFLWWSWCPLWRIELVPHRNNSCARDGEVERDSYHDMFLFIF